MVKCKYTDKFYEIQKSFVCTIYYVHAHFVLVLNLCVHITRLLTNVHVIFSGLGKEQCLEAYLKLVDRYVRASGNFEKSRNKKQHDNKVKYLKILVEYLYTLLV